MNQRYVDYASYNIWANDRLISNLQEHNDQILTQELVASFPTIRATLLHIWFAETGWLSRLNGKGWNAKKVLEFTGSNQEFFREWKKTSIRFRDFVSQTNLEKEIEFEHKGEQFSIPTREIIQTVMNHGSYHRGQVVLMMRQLGINNILQTDYIEWVREKERIKREA